MSVATAVLPRRLPAARPRRGTDRGRDRGWHVAVGDEVAVDQIVVEVETAKATVELPCPHAGRVHQLHGEPGQLLAVGSPLLSVATAGSADSAGSASSAASVGSVGAVDAAPAPVAGEPAALAQYREEEQAGSGAVLIGYGTAEAKRTRRRRVGAPTAPAPTLAVPTPAVPTTGTPAPLTPAPRAVQVISPIVRRLARDHGIDLSQLTPASPDEILRRRDVEAAIARASERLPDAHIRHGGPRRRPHAGRRAPAAGPADRCAAVARPTGPVDDLHIPLRGVRRTIADRMTTSRREIPDATTWVDADATALLEAKDAIRAMRPDAGIGVLALMARIVVAGLRRFPELNARVDTGREEIVQLSRVNLGFAAQSPRGLVVPVVHDAGSMTTSELAGALRELTDLARHGALTPAQMTGGTFTLNNYAQDPLGHHLLLLLEVGELDGLVLRLVAEAAHLVGDLAVLVRDPLQELGALEQVAEAVGLEDHGQRVGRVRLVDLNEPPCQHGARGGQPASEPLEPVARGLEPVAHGEQLLLLRVEAALDLVEPPLRGRDLPLHGVDPAAVALDRGAEHALLRLVVLDLRLLLLDAARQRCRAARHRQHQEGRYGKRYGKQKAFLHAARSAPGSPRLPSLCRAFQRSRRPHSSNVPRQGNPVSFLCKTAPTSH